MSANLAVCSAANFERLWSLARRLLSDYRKCCTPILLFLRISDNCYHLELVSKAMSKRKTNKTIERIRSLGDE